MKSIPRSVFLVATEFAMAIWSMAALAELHPSVTRSDSTVSHGTHDLHLFIMILCLLIALGVFSVLIYSTIAHRRSNSAMALQGQGNIIQEVGWMLIPLGILVVAVIPVTKDMMRHYGTGDVDITVEVTGHEGGWHYAYVNEGISFLSSPSTEHVDKETRKGKRTSLEVDNPLVLPVGEKIRFVFAAGDEGSIWLVPEFGWETDVTLGAAKENWVKIDKPGVYRGHGHLPIVVIAKLEDDYKQWVQGTKASSQSDTSH